MNRYQVLAPERGFSGEACGVVFSDGAAVVSDESKEGRAAIEYFRRRGYTLTPEQVDEEGQAEPHTPDEGDEPFDPSKHDVPEVLAYLDRHEDEDTRSAEFDRVIEAEKAGKARKTILARAGSEGDETK